jgi:hypothetical protein
MCEGEKWQDFFFWWFKAFLIHHKMNIMQNSWIKNLYLSLMKLIVWLDLMLLM